MRNFFPAAAQGVIAVAALGRRIGIDGLWSSNVGASNFGETVDIVAPGEAIPSTWIGSGNIWVSNRCLSGTSMAAPLVAGAIAVMMAGNRRNGITQTPREIRDRLRSDATVLRANVFPENTPPLFLNMSRY